MKFIAYFKSERSGKETEQELLDCPNKEAAIWLAKQSEKESYPPWKLIEVKEQAPAKVENK